MLDYSRFDNGIEGPYLVDYILSLQYTVAPKSAPTKLQMPFYGYNFINKKKNTIAVSSQLPNMLKNCNAIRLSAEPTIVFLTDSMVEPSYAATYTQAIVDPGTSGLCDNGRYFKSKRKYIQSIRNRVRPYYKEIPITSRASD
jgi:hypothetical protein